MKTEKVDDVEEVFSLLKTLEYPPQPPKEFPDDRVFLCICVKGLFKKLAWKTKKVESDFDEDHYVVSVKRKESDDYEAKTNHGLKLDIDSESPEETTVEPTHPTPVPKPVPVRTTPTTKKRGRPRKAENEEVVKEKVEEKKPDTFHGMTVIQEDVFVTIDRRIFSQKIVTGEESPLLPGAYMMTHTKKEGVSYLGVVIDGWFIGQQLAKWQMYREGHFGTVKVEIENLQE
ncbi:MAG: hypothetical protein WC629_02215 [Candidatus Paceibacterota bacterium]|jgi:hypothetical protein